MIAGHAPLIFGIVAGGAAMAGFDRRRAILFGMLAGLFTVIPDVDMIYAVGGVLGTAPIDVWSATEVFWRHSSIVHRGLTHSVLIGGIAAIGFALIPDRSMYRLLGIVVLVGFVVLGFGMSGFQGALIMTFYGLGGAVISFVAANKFHLGIREIAGLAIIGLMSHPFTDLFTGDPPALLYPLSIPIFTERIALFPDPTLHLLGVFGLELIGVWFGVIVASQLSQISLWTYVDPRAVIGGGYGLVAMVLPAPTLDVSYHFVFSVLAVGTIGIVSLTNGISRARMMRAGLTGLTAVTCAGIAYAIVYLTIFY